MLHVPWRWVTIQASPIPSVRSKRNSPVEDYGESIDAPMQQQSFLVWFISSLGWRYGLLLPLVAAIAFILTVIIVLRGRGPYATAALLLIVPMPLIVGMVGVVDGLMNSLMVIAMSSSSPKPSVFAQGISTSLVTAMVGFLLMFPSYMLAMLGMFARSLGLNAEK